MSIFTGLHYALAQPRIYASRYDNLQAAIDAAVATGWDHPIVVHDRPSSGGAVAGPAGISLLMPEPYTYTGGLNEAAITLGTAGTPNYTIEADVWVLRETTGDWTNDSSVGIRFINANTGHLRVREAKGFTVGVECLGDGGGFNYNDVRLGYLRNNRYGVRLTGKNAGWCNENWFSGGRFTVETGINTATSRFGVLITSDDASYLVHNNNLFVKPSFELNATSATAEAIPVHVEHGRHNEFISVRVENCDTPTLRESNDSFDNSMELGYGDNTSEVVDDTGTYAGSRVQLRRQSRFYAGSTPVFVSGPIHKKAFSSGASVGVPGMAILRSAGNIVETDALTVAAEYVEISGSYNLGVYVDTRDVKRFILRGDTHDDQGGRYVVQCYDSAGTVLTSAGGGHPYVKTVADFSFTYTATYGGVYRSGSDSTVDRYFQVGDDVAYIFVGIGGGTAAARVRSFQVHAIEARDEGAPAAWSGYEKTYGAANGIATLDASTKVPATQLPDAATGARGAVLMAAALAQADPTGNIANPTGNGAPDAPAVYSEASMQTELDKLKANDDAVRTALVNLIADHNALQTQYAELLANLVASGALQTT